MMQAAHVDVHLPWQRPNCAISSSFCQLFNSQMLLIDIEEMLSGCVTQTQNLRKLEHEYVHICVLMGVIC